MVSSDVPDRQVNAETLIAMAALVGVELSEERAQALVPQAEPHFGLMRALDGQDPRGFEIAAQFRLDRQVASR